MQRLGKQSRDSNHIVSFESEPDIEREFTDESGSSCYYLVWGDTTRGQIYYPDTGCFVIYQNGDLSMASSLDGLEDGTPYDYTDCPDSVARFLLPVPYEVQSDNPAIIDFAQNEFTYACQFRYEVVSKRHQMGR